MIIDQFHRFPALQNNFRSRFRLLQHVSPLMRQWFRRAGSGLGPDFRITHPRACTLIDFCIQCITRVYVQCRWWHQVVTYTRLIECLLPMYCPRSLRTVTGYLIGVFLFTSPTIQAFLHFSSSFMSKGIAWCPGWEIPTITNEEAAIVLRGSWVRIPAKARRGICEQDTLKSTARGSQNKQNCLRHVPPNSVKKKKVLRHYKHE
jgi:hypothetical protein